MIMEILGIAGLGLNILNYFQGSKMTKEQQKLLAEEGLAATEVGIKEAQYKASGYEEFLAKVPTAGESLSRTTGDLEFDERYRTLLRNYGNLNVAAGMTGRVAAGTSMAAAGAQAMTNIEDLVGTKTKEATQQLDIYQTTLEKLGEAKERYEDVLNPGSAIEEIVDKLGDVPVIGEGLQGIVENITGWLDKLKEMFE